MRVLVLAEGYPYGKSLSGVFHVNQFRLLAEAGIDLSVVAPTPWVPPGLMKLRPRWSEYAEAPFEQKVDGFTVFRPRYLTFPGEHKWGAPHRFQYRAIKKMGLPRPDVVQSFFALPLGAVGRLLAKDWKVPHVVTMLGDDVTIMPYMQQRHRRLFTKVLNEAALAVANGPSLAKEAAGIAGCDVVSLSLGADGNRFEGLPDKKAARETLGLPQDSFLPLYVGGLLVDKGVPELAEALGQMEEGGVQGVFVGDGPERAAIEGRERILCVGMKPPAEIPMYMAAADVLVLPSHHEGLPTAVVEAGFAKLPVIGTDIGGITDLIGEERGFVVPLKNVDRLTETLISVMNAPDEAQRRAERLTVHVWKHYEVHATTENLIARYRQLIGIGS